VPLPQGALVALEAKTGRVRALVGGTDFGESPFNRAVQARRQPGSSFKPFVYAASFERGFSPASIVLDAPVVFRQRNGKVWRPQNDSGNFAGPMRLREAMVQSRNLVSVRLLDAIGVDFARKYISHFGFEEEHLPPNLSMSLGTASLTPMSVARLMIAITLGDVPRAPKADGSLWTVAEPALGAGGMVLAAMGHIVSSHGTAALGAWGFYGMDLDLLCARMAAAQIVMQCDIQEAPVGELVIWQGNSLTMEHRRLVVHAEHRARATARAPVKLRAAG